MKKEKENLEVEAFEMADKKHMILKMLFGVLAFIVVVISCFGAGYFGAQLGNKENNNEETKNEEQNKEDKEEVEKLTIDSQIVKELFEIFREDRNCMMAGLWDLYSELDAKKYIAYFQIGYKI